MKKEIIKYIKKKTRKWEVVSEKPFDSIFVEGLWDESREFHDQVIKLIEPFDEKYDIIHKVETGYTKKDRKYYPLVRRRK